MRILFTVHTYYPNRDGVQFVTEYLCEGLASKGHQVDVITYLYKDRGMITAEEKNGVSILRWDAKTKNTFHIGDKKGYRNYVIKKQSNYDVMINVGTQTALTDWLLPVIDRITIPKILYIHSIWDFKIHDTDRSSLSALARKLWANFRWQIYYHQYGRAFKQYNAVTQLHKHDYSYSFFKRRYNIQSHIFENAAEDIFFEDKGIKPCDLPEKYIIYVANYNNRKNQKESIEAFYEVAIPPNWTLVLIGSSRNNYYDMLEEYNMNLRKHYGLKEGEKKVILLYNVERSKVCEYIRHGNIYMTTSKWEAFPISLTEAMASRIPFISRKVGIVEYLPGGIVYNTHTQLVKKLEWLVTNESLRQGMANEGFQFAQKHFMIQEKVNQFEQLINDITNK